MLRQIKRYKNRKLYDHLTREYLNFAQIAELVREGHEIQVLQATSKEDLTSYVLAQAIAAEEKPGSRPEVSEGLHSLLKRTKPPEKNPEKSAENESP